MESLCDSCKLKSCPIYGEDKIEGVIISSCAASEGFNDKLEEYVDIFLRTDLDYIIAGEFSSIPYGVDLEDIKVYSKNHISFENNILSEDNPFYKHIKALYDIRVMMDPCVGGLDRQIRLLEEFDSRDNHLNSINLDKEEEALKAQLKNRVISQEFYDEQMLNLKKQRENSKKSIVDDAAKEAEYFPHDKGEKLPKDITERLNDFNDYVEQEIRPADLLISNQKMRDEIEAKENKIENLHLALNKKDVKIKNQARELTKLLGTLNKIKSFLNGEKK